MLYILQSHSKIWIRMFLFLSFGYLQSISNINVYFAMNRKINMGEVYVPSTAKNHIYYPIEINKTTPEQSFERPPQTTVRVQKYRQKQVDALRRANEEMKEREEVYIDKLMKLQEGLENQHSEFIKLQELYTELFESYKQKQAQIAQLQSKYRETQRYRNIDRPQDGKNAREKEELYESKDIFASKNPELTVRETDWLNKEKKWKQRENELLAMNQILTDKIMKSNEKFQKFMQDGSQSRVKDKMMQSRTNINQQKIMDELQESHRQVTIEKEARLKYQYQNQFLKNRSRDLEDQRQELQKLLAYKQKEIAKLREEKIRIHRQSSQKMMSRSPSHNNRVVFKPLSPFNNSIAEEKEKYEGNTENEASLSFQNSKNTQYFSFSRQKKEISLEEELPNFPPELEIDALINQHTK